MTSNSRPNHDPVNHPSHYVDSRIKCQHCGETIECIDVIENFTLAIGNAVKYLWRYENKDNPVEDLSKAVWFIKREQERIVRGEKKNV